MPKSKRAKVVSLTKVSKKSTKEAFSTLRDEIHENVDKWKYIWVFGVAEMRNSASKGSKKAMERVIPARIFYGRSTVMGMALGRSAEDEYKAGLSELGRRVYGNVGLFFTNSPPQEVIEWFDDFKVDDYARAKTVAPKTVVIPAGPVMQGHSDPPEPFPHSMEPQLRKLGLSTRLDRGVPTLDNPHTVCEKGDELTANQSQILKLIGEKLAVFKVVLKVRWEKETGEADVIIDDVRPKTLAAEKKAEEDAAVDSDEDEAMGDE